MAETGSKIFDLTVITEVADDDVLVGVDVSDDTESTDGTCKGFTARNMLNKLNDGWIPAQETLVYATALTITVTGDQTTKYYKGVKIKLTQSTGGTKYFFVFSSSYSSPNTTITLVENTTHTLVNETITNPYYSLVEAPTGFPWIGNSIMARAYLSSNQSDLVNATFTKVLLNTENFDIGSDFDTTNSKFVVPITGIYHIDAHLRFSAAPPDKLYLLSIYANGSEIRRVYDSAGSDGTGEGTVHFSDLFKLSADDYVELYARHLAGVDTVDIVGGSTYTYMSICLKSI